MLLLLLLLLLLLFLLLLSFYLTRPFYVVLHSNIFDINNIETTQYTEYFKNITSLFNLGPPVAIPARSFHYLYFVSIY